MDGQKKSEHMMDRIRDLALGEIHPQDELALLAHVAECEACRDAYNQAVALLIAFAMSSWMHRERSAPSAPIEALTVQIPPAVTPSSTATSNLGIGASRAADSQLPRTANPQRQGTNPPARAPEAHVTASRAPESHETGSRPASREPEVLVPKDELRAVAQLYQATQSGLVDAEQLYVAQQKTREPVEVKPIEITPLESAADSVPNSAKGPGLP